MIASRCPRLLAASLSAVRNAGVRSAVPKTGVAQYHALTARKLAFAPQIAAIAKQPRLSRPYSDGPPPLTREFVQERVTDVLANCDKIDPAKLTLDARLEEDLGLDSLDVVDALFFIEEEFTVQMPDHEANEIKTVKDVVDWVFRQPDSV